MSVNNVNNTNFTTMPVPTNTPSNPNLNPTSLFSPQDIDGNNPPNTTTSPGDGSANGGFGSLWQMFSGMFSGDKNAQNQGLMGIYNAENARYEAQLKEAKAAEGEQAVKAAEPQSKEEAYATLGDASDFWKNNPRANKENVDAKYLEEVANSNPNDGKYSAKTIAAARYINDSESAKKNLDSANYKDGKNATDGLFSKGDFKKLGTPSDAPKDYKEAATTLRNDPAVWDNIPEGDDKKNGFVSKDYLKQIAENKDGKFSAKTAAAAKYSLENQLTWDNFDTGGRLDKKNRVDDRFSKWDLEQILK